MRFEKGKLITVWVPGNHGAGGSTLADGIGIGIQHFTGKKTLIINFSGGRSYMERFLENDMELKYTIDYLKGFGSDINLEHINTFSTQINDNLYVLPGSKLNDELTKPDKQFEINLLDKCLEGFDIVVADITTGIKEQNQEFLDRADLIMAVMTANEIMLDDIYESLSKAKIKSYIQDERTIGVFNMMYGDWDMEKELRRLGKKYQLESAYGIEFDGNVFDACCMKRRFYSYLIKQFKCCSSPFPAQIEELCELAAERLDIAYTPQDRDGRGFFAKIFKQKKVTGCDK